MNNPLAFARLLADAGLPMIFLTFPAMLILLIPVIVIEGFLCKKWLGLAAWQALKANAVSNTASTLIGVPVGWAVMFGLEFGAVGLLSNSPALQSWHSPIADLVFFLISSAWIGPPEGAGWTIPCATAVLLVPFFFASYVTEYLIVNHMVGTPEGDPRDRGSRRVRRAVRNANLVTYGIMLAATTVWLMLSLPHR